MKEGPGIFIAVTERDILLPDLIARIQNPLHGAQVVFCGTIRRLNGAKSVIGVSYDIFEPLAEKLFLEYSCEAQRQWGGQVVLVHRKGRVDVGKIAVVVLTSTPHRNEAYEASRYLIEKIKHDAPIWKKEHFEDGDSQWIQGCALAE